MGTWDAVCKPQSQPSECPNDSWNQLFGENGVGNEDLENCEGLLLAILYYGLN